MSAENVTVCQEELDCPVSFNLRHINKSDFNSLFRTYQLVLPSGCDETVSFNLRHPTVFLIYLRQSTLWAGMIGLIAANEMKIHLMIDKFRLTDPVSTPAGGLPTPNLSV